jgi:hypothetical protein
LSFLTLTREGGKVRLEWYDLNALILSVSFLIDCVTRSYLENGEM